MNYRHAYHAGNFADVMKHIALMLVMQHLGRKDKPFRVIDTHAGCGWYCLDSDAAERTGEWRGGFGRLVAPDTDLARLKSGDVLAEYISVVARAEAAIRARADVGDRPVYPGSPAIAQAMLREADRLHVNELHPEDHALLAADLARDRRVVVTRQNGWHILKAALPPKERRGVILIDPPFEESGEFDRLAESLAAAWKRFATGIVLLWYPIKDRAAVDGFYRRVAGLVSEQQPILRCELAIDSVGSDGPLAATGLLVCNPPYRFEETYRAVLDDLARALARTPAARASVTAL
jgi:23S rRNA (adenine2030-N6)-methyltransferase